MNRDPIPNYVNISDCHEAIQKIIEQYKDTDELSLRLLYLTSEIAAANAVYMVNRDKKLEALGNE